MVDICTMWDDGLVTDLPLIEALNERGIIASFALSPGRYKDVHTVNDNRGDFGTLITASEMRCYYKHDIVSHGVNHYDMTMLASDMLRWELKHSQRHLSGIFHREITGFCYPYGRTDHSTELMVAEFYKQARSLPPESKVKATKGKFSNPHDVHPSAHWALDGLAAWALTGVNSRVLIWGHTYEFGQGGLAKALKLYDTLKDGGARFVTFEEIVHERYD